MKMMSIALAAFSCLILSCEGQSLKNNGTMNSLQGNNTSENKIAHSESKPAPYELHGIIDPGIHNIVAFAMLTPTSWKMQQSFTRKWNGSTPINQVHIRLASPNGDIVEFLPYTPYYYADGPTTRSLRQTAASYGMPSQQNQGELAPMAPLDYIKRIMIPQMGIKISITGEKILSPAQTEANTKTFNAYVDGRTADGKKLRIDCLTNLVTTNMNGEVYYNWNVSPSVTQTMGDIDACYKHVQKARNSFKVNPEWQRYNTQLVRNGNIANDEINRRNARINKDYRDHVQKTGDEITEMRNRSVDQRNESFRDAIGGQAKYADPETGARVRLADKYDHVYKDRQGNYYGTNAGVNAAEFDWIELERLETKNY